MSFYIFISIIFIFICACLAGPVEDLLPSRWYEVPNSHLASAAPSGWSANVIAPWCSGAFDTKRSRYIIWGGGHSDYSGNEIYAFDMASLGWERLTDPCPNTGGGEGTGEYPLWNNTIQPRSRHTYEYIEYMPSIDRFCTFGGSGQYPSGGITTAAFHVFNFDTELWERRPPTPGYGIAAISAYDPVTGHAWVHGTDSKAYLAEYAPEAGTYGTWYTRSTLVGNFMYKYYLTMELDPKRRKLVAVGQGDVYAWDISNPASPVRTSLSTSGATNMVSAQAPGLAYDPVTERMISWSGGQTVYSLNLDDNTWTSHSGGGANPGSATSTGTNGRFRYVPSKNVFIVTSSKDANVFIYRHTADAAAPQWYLDLLNNVQAVEAKPDVSDEIEISVNPNPFKSRAVITIGNKFRVTSYELHIFDITGKHLETRNSKLATRNSFSWNAPGLPAGIYILKVRAGTRETVKRLVKLR